MDADARCRAVKIAVWARAQNEAGHKLDPRMLAPDGVHRGPESDVHGNGWPITALFFLEGTDLGEATKIAEGHPALRDGASVEVRHWVPPVEVPTSTGCMSAPPANADTAARGIVRVPWQTVPWVRLGA
jgi:hypothetical protein